MKRKLIGIISAVTVALCFSGNAFAANVSDLNQNTIVVNEDVSAYYDGGNDRWKNKNLKAPLRFIIRLSTRIGIPPKGLIGEMLCL